MGLNGERIRSMQSRFRLVNIRATIHREGEKEEKKLVIELGSRVFAMPCTYITVFKPPLYPKLPRRCGNSGYDLSRIDSFLTAFIVIADKYFSFIAGCVPMKFDVLYTNSQNKLKFVTTTPTPKYTHVHVHVCMRACIYMYWGKEPKLRRDCVLTQ